MGLVSCYSGGCCRRKAWIQVLHHIRQLSSITLESSHVISPSSSTHRRQLFTDVWRSSKKEFKKKKRNAVIGSHSHIIPAPGNPFPGYCSVVVYWTHHKWNTGRLSWAFLFSSNVLRDKNRACKNCPQRDDRKGNTMGVKGAVFPGCTLDLQRSSPQRSSGFF